MQILGRYIGRNGEIEICEHSTSGTRSYFESGILQSQATPAGDSVFTYVRVMEDLLRTSNDVLVLGCGGGNLATKLAGLGKRLTIVDNNPISFVIAQRYFGLPDHLPCIVSDFRKFVQDDRTSYDAIAVDVGGPGFRFNEQFDVATCDALRDRLAKGGRIVMNVTVDNDIDPVPDWIASRLAGDVLYPWIVDECGIEDRNAVIACIAEPVLPKRASLQQAMCSNDEKWSLRRGRIRKTKAAGVHGNE